MSDANHKDSKGAVLYFNPWSIGDPAGARCGICYKYVTNGTCIEVEGSINPARGICGLYIYGEPRLADPGFRLRKVSKAEAGYAETGPTHCKNCEYMKLPQQEMSLCSEVEGVIHGLGCCNEHERRSEDGS